MKVRSPFGKHNLGSAVGLRVKVFSPLGDTNRVTLQWPRRLGMEHPETGLGGGEGRSGKGGVEEAAESRLNNLARSRGFLYLMELEVW